ncbi:hypothetical protein P4O66_009966 [Electrophorus voltai]|uniref:Uncharacterized protein n=1 Tax=Electrophorus voltai TaxID=2609070 RepID=A0AAD8ZBK4_9TELE|nr:hypothetical protein P4O66_009966 [Electrophorus voltai]
MRARGAQGPDSSETEDASPRRVRQATAAGASVRQLRKEGEMKCGKEGDGDRKKRRERNFQRKRERKKKMTVRADRRRPHAYEDITIYVIWYFLEDGRAYAGAPLPCPRLWASSVRMRDEGLLTSWSLVEAPARCMFTRRLCVSLSLAVLIAVSSPAYRDGLPSCVRPGTPTPAIIALHLLSERACRLYGNVSDLFQGDSWKTAGYEGFLHGDITGGKCQSVKSESGFEWWSLPSPGVLLDRDGLIAVNQSGKNKQLYSSMISSLTVQDTVALLSVKQRDKKGVKQADPGHAGLTHPPWLPVLNCAVFWLLLSSPLLSSPLLSSPLLSSPLHDWRVILNPSLASPLTAPLTQIQASLCPRSTAVTHLVLLAPASFEYDVTAAARMPKVTVLCLSPLAEFAWRKGPPVPLTLRLGSGSWHGPPSGGAGDVNLQNGGKRSPGLRSLSDKRPHIGRHVGAMVPTRACACPSALDLPALEPVWLL